LNGIPDIETYLERIKTKEEVFRHIRVLFVGEKGVGKTTICKRLQGENVSVGNERRTNGAELYLDIFEIEIDKNIWTTTNNDSEQKVINRLGSILVSQDDTEGILIVLFTFQFC